MKRNRILFYVFGALLVSVGMSKLFGLYLESGPLGNFPQPAFFPFKVSIFAAGMILGCLTAWCDRDGDKGVFWLCYFLCLLFMAKIVAAAAILIAALVFVRSGPAALLGNILSHKVFKFLGDVSYSVYLAHVMILYVLLDRFMHWKFFVEAGAPLRFAITAGIVTPLVFATAGCLHKYIELPGIEIGKNLTRCKAAAPPAAQIAQEAAL